MGIKRTVNRARIGRNGICSSGWHSIEIESTLERAAEVEAQILEDCKSCCFQERDFFALKLGLEEAIINAVKHGNKLDPNKHVHIQYRVTPERVDVEIEDEGPGFNPAAVPDPTDEAHLDVPGGRGLLLMRAYMSNVVFNSAGNKVTLTKFNDNPPTASPAAPQQRVAYG